MRPCFVKKLGWPGPTRPILHYRPGGNVANRLIQSSKREWIELTAKKAAKKIRLEDTSESSFKKPSIKNQHKSCTAVLNAIEDVLESLNNEYVETAKTILQQGKKYILHRIKLL